MQRHRSDMPGAPARLSELSISSTASTVVTETSPRQHDLDERGRNSHHQASLSRASSRPHTPDSQDTVFDPMPSPLSLPLPLPSPPDITSPAKAHLAGEACFTLFVADSAIAPPDVARPKPSLMEMTSLAGIVRHHEERSSSPTRVSSAWFRSRLADGGFGLAIVLGGFLSEYLITGFAIELYQLDKHLGGSDGGKASSTGMFWPATLLTLIQGALLLPSARVADMFGGYFTFMFGMGWLVLWSLVAGFAHNIVLLSVCRAMQGVGVAAFTPAVNTLLSHVYEGRPKCKSRCLGWYAGAAPFGFFMGLLVASALPQDKTSWYFWIAATLAFSAALLAYTTVPIHGINFKKVDLKFDWYGSILIVVGLLLICYALAVEPQVPHGFRSAEVLAPLLSGAGVLAAAVYVEVKVADCPLFPRTFFAQKGVVPISFACLCFYACYGIWLYYSAEFFQSPMAEGTKQRVTGIKLAAWYLPTAVGGLILCGAGGYLLHIIRAQYILSVSALAWVGAPLLLIFCPDHIKYWAFILPSMLCATAGLDLTYLVTLCYLGELGELKHQGFAGAYCSILINLGISFALPIGEIVGKKVNSTNASFSSSPELSHRAFRAIFILAAALATVGALIVFLFVRIPRATRREQPSGEEQHV